MKHLKDRSLIDYQFNLLEAELAAEVARHLDACDQCRERASQLAKRLSTLDVLKGEPGVTDDLIKRTLAQAKPVPAARPLRIRALPWLAAAAALVVVVASATIWLGNQSKPSESPKGAASVTPDKDRRMPLALAPTRTPASGSSEQKTKGLGGMAEAERFGATAGQGLVARDESEASAPQPTSGGELRPANNEQPTTNNQPAPASASTLAASGRVTGIEQPGAGLAQRLAADGLQADLSRPAPTANEQRIANSEEPPPFAPASAIELVTLPRRDSVQLTVYNSADLTLVRDRRSLILKKGWNWLQFMWANTLIDPTSLDLEPREHKDQIEVRQLVYPARLKEVGRWLIHSNVDERVPFEITYFTSGISWRAFYSGTLTTDERSSRLEGYVRVTNNSGEDYENAQVRLIVGQVHLLDQIADLAQREYPYGTPLPLTAAKPEDRRRDLKLDLSFALDGAAPSPGVAGAYFAKEFVKEGLSEYFLYTIEGTETIPNGWSKRMISFTADQIPVVNLCKYEEERYGSEVVRMLSFKNDKDHKMGLTPIPDGRLEVCRAAGDKGQLSYVGAAAFKYIPVGQEVELNLGQARDVVVEPKCMDLKKDSLRFDPKGNISGWDEVRAWRISVRNTRDIPVKAEIRRNFPTVYWKLTRSDAVGAYEQVDKDTVKFTLELTPRSSQTFEYQLRTYHGTREQDWRQ